MTTPGRTLATARHHGMILTDLHCEAPLDHANPEGERLQLFARAIADAENPDAQHPWLVYLQGGPDATWSVLGQSYGGFRAVHYLSAHPEGLREVFITGGLPPLTASADDYYRATYPMVRRRQCAISRVIPATKNSPHESCSICTSAT